MLNYCQIACYAIHRAYFELLQSPYIIGVGVIVLTTLSSLYKKTFCTQGFRASLSECNKHHLYLCRQMVPCHHESESGETRQPINFPMTPGRQVLAVGKDAQFVKSKGLGRLQALRDHYRNTFVAFVTFVASLVTLLPNAPVPPWI